MNMELTLPDKSTVYFDHHTFDFMDRPMKIALDTLNTSQSFDIELFRENIENPKYSFGKCFRRLNDTPRYSGIQSTYIFDFTFLKKLFKLNQLSGYGGMFSSSESQHGILDGKIIEHQGYDWGSHSWTA